MDKRKGRNSKIPPARRKAGIEIPAKFRMLCPKIENTSKMPIETRQARIAMARRFCTDIPAVRATKSAARPMGSMMTTSAKNALMWL